MRRKGSRTALIYTRRLSLPSAGASLQSVLAKGGKLLFLIRIRMVLNLLIAILYSIHHRIANSQCGFKRPRLPWSLVKQWLLDEYDREVAYEEIKAIMTQSLDDAGSKIFIKPNANSIAGWRPKQGS